MGAGRRDDPAGGRRAAVRGPRRISAGRFTTRSFAGGSGSFSQARTGSRGLGRSGGRFGLDGGKDDCGACVAGSRGAGGRGGSGAAAGAGFGRRGAAGIGGRVPRGDGLLPDSGRPRRLRRRGRARGHRPGDAWGLRPQGLPADLALRPVRGVVRPADRAEDEVQDVRVLPGPRGLRLLVRFELRPAPRARRVPRGDEAPAVRAEEQEARLLPLEDAVHVAPPELLGTPEAGLEEGEGLLPVDAEGSGEADDCLIDDEGPAVAAVRRVWGHRLLADGTEGPGLFPGHERSNHPWDGAIRVLTPLSGPIVASRAP